MLALQFLYVNIAAPWDASYWLERPREEYFSLAVVAQLTGVRDSGDATPLDALRNLCAADLARVNQLIIDHMQSEVPLIPQLAGHLIAAGGKRYSEVVTEKTLEILAGHQPKRLATETVKALDGIYRQAESNLNEKFLSA